MLLKRGQNDKLSIAEKLLSPCLTTDRLIVQSPAKNDYQDWSKTRQQNEEFLKPFEPEWPKDCLSEKFYSSRLARQVKDRNAGLGAYFFLKLRDTKKIIGGLNLNNIQMGAARHASLGYWLSQDVQGKGYMFEAINEIIGYSFGTIGLKRLNAACLSDNERSIKMLLNLGFEEEGYAKNYFQINGKWQDHRLFGLCNQSLSTTA